MKFKKKYLKLKAYLRLENRLKKTNYTLLHWDKILNFSSPLPKEPLVLLSLLSLWIMSSTFRVSKIISMQLSHSGLHASCVLRAYSTYTCITWHCRHLFTQLCLLYWLLWFTQSKRAGLDFHTEPGLVLSFNKFMTESQIYISSPYRISSSVIFIGVSYPQVK